MKKSKVKPYSLKGVFNKEEKKNPPDYVVIDGNHYERLETKTVSVDLDLDPDVLITINNTFKQGGFVNKAEVIRSALRFAVLNEVK